MQLRSYTVAPIWLLAWEFPYATGVPPPKKFCLSEFLEGSGVVTAMARVWYWSRNCHITVGMAKYIFFKSAFCCFLECIYTTIIVVLFSKLDPSIHPSIHRVHFLTDILLNIYYVQNFILGAEDTVVAKILPALEKVTGWEIHMSSTKYRDADHAKLQVCPRCMGAFGSAPHLRLGEAGWSSEKTSRSGWETTEQHWKVRRHCCVEVEADACGPVLCAWFRVACKSMCRDLEGCENKPGTASITVL